MTYYVGWFCFAVETVIQLMNVPLFSQRRRKFYNPTHDFTLNPLLHPPAAFPLPFLRASRHDLGCLEVSGGPAQLLRASRHDLGCLEVSGGPAVIMRRDLHQDHNPP